MRAGRPGPAMDSSAQPGALASPALTVHQAPAPSRLPQSCITISD